MNVLIALMMTLPPQHQHRPPAQATPQHEQSTDATHQFLMSQASGTGISPPAATAHMAMKQVGPWNLMTHGLAFVSQVEQTGPRGDEEFFSTNWFMVMADRPLAGGRLMLRSMLSLEPATVPGKFYPQLFQTGETANGRPIVDGQHPHDFFMELSAQYVRQIGPDTFVSFYAAPHGDPALGPVAFPHRVSAAEIPQASLSHHVQDSTHIASSVLTGVVARGPVRFEVSAFHGEEPDEERWDIDLGAIDSWSARLTLIPSPNWTAQISTGHLTEPEALEPGDIDRTTASLTYFRPLTRGSFAGSVVWGHNDKEHSEVGIDSYLAEAVWQFRTRNYVTGRVEVVDKDELLVNEPHVLTEIVPEPHEVFRVNAFTLGFTRDLWSAPSYIAGVGGNITFYNFPSELKRFYGSDPQSYYLFLRIRSNVIPSEARNLRIDLP